MDTEDKALRPTGLSGFLGQEESKRSLHVAIQSARMRNEPLDHILFSGPPGLGKTTLAQIMATEMGSRLVVVNAPSIRVKGDLAAILLDLGPKDTLFIDEIHSLQPKVEEILYSAMEDYKLSLVTGQGQSTSAVVLPLPPFTIIGATTRLGSISQPLRDRFGEVVHMSFYTVDELSVIVDSSSKKLNVNCVPMAARMIAERSRGTPRIANRVLRKSRDVAVSMGTDTINTCHVDMASDYMGIDNMGLDKVSRSYMNYLIGRRGNAVGIDAMAAAIGESRDTLEESVEPFLMRMGLIDRTAKGRVATIKAMGLI